MFKRKNKKTIRKAGAILGIFGMIFLQAFPLGVQAEIGPGDLIDVTPGDDFDDLVDQGMELSNSTTQNSANAIGSVAENVRNKEAAPMVSVSFSGEDNFKEGSKVTATAVPGGFAEDTEDLYFTWFIKHKYCGIDYDENSVKGDRNKQNCDKDGDNKITPNDWKISAVKSGLRNSSRVDMEQLKAVPSVSDWDGDSGDDEKADQSDVENCYVKAPNGGVFYELRKTNITYSEPPSGYEAACVYDANVSCEVLNPEYVTDLGSDYETDPTTRIPSVNTDKTITQDTNACIEYSKGNDKNEVFDCKVDNTENFEAVINCTQRSGDNYDLIPMYVRNDNNNNTEIRMNDITDGYASHEEASQPAVESDNTISYNETIYPARTFTGTAPLPDSQPPISSTSIDSYKNLLGIIFETGVTNENQDQEQIKEEICPQLYYRNEYNDNADGDTASPRAYEPQQEQLQPEPNLLDILHIDENWAEKQAGMLSTVMFNIGENASQSVIGVTQDCESYKNVLTRGFSKTATTKATISNPDPEEKTVAFINGESGVTPTCSFGTGANICQHLFPTYPKEDDNLKNKKIGDNLGGKLSDKEKEFWGIDDENSTDGYKNENSIMGLGVDTLTWTYMKDDEVGVAVEGKTDLLTEHKDSSYRRMWAFPKGACKVLDGKTVYDGTIKATNGYYIEEYANGNIGIMTTEIKTKIGETKKGPEGVDACLEENLLKPEDNGASNMGLILNATPANPINGSETDPGDQVSVIASMLNNADLTRMRYVWDVDKVENDLTPNDETKWEEITTKMINNESFSKEDVQGIGKNNLKILLNLPTEGDNSIVSPNNFGVFYLRVRVEAEELTGVDNKKIKKSIIIKVQQQENQMKVYPVTADADASGNILLSLNKTVPETCVAPEEKISGCMVTKNQIVGIEIPDPPAGMGTISDFTWKVNNVSMNCTKDISNACVSNGANTFFFPITGEEGETFTVVAKALKTSGSSKARDTVEFRKQFVIVKPQVQISSIDETKIWPKLVDFYTDLDGNSKPNKSTEVFQVYPETSSAQLMATVFPSVDNGEFNWEIDSELEPSSSTNEIVFPVVDKQVGESYVVGVTVFDKTPKETVNNLRKALLQNWNIAPTTYNAFGDRDSLNASIQTDVVENPAAIAANASKKGVMASLITNFPEQAFFLLQLVLTAFALIFFMGLLFAFIPESVFEKKEARSN